MVADIRPAAVLGLGGFAAGPLVRVAAGRGVPTALLNPDAIPGKANRYLARRVGTIFAQFPQTVQRFEPSCRAKVRVVGCPIRSSVTRGERRESLAALGLREDRRTLLVMGGSLGAETINQAALGCVGLMARLAQRWQVLHITGMGKAEQAAAVYRQAGVGCAVLDFCDRMDRAYAVADLAIGRAGANTVAELAATGTPAILLPYPHHRDQHQRHNAADMVSAGAAVLVDDRIDPAANAAAVGAALAPLMDDDSRLEAMSAAALALGRPTAAREVADWLMEAAQRS